MTVLLGLTGSIGMGKSTTAQMFRDLGVPVWDADETVHRLYGPGGAASAPLAALVPAAVSDAGVDRVQLKAAIAKDPGLLGKIERIVHPLVTEDRARFRAENAAAPLLVFDIPLLFETGGEATLDAVLVVSADPQTQRNRVLARPGMTEDTFQSLLSRQTPDAEKRAKADYVIQTLSLDQTRAEVADLVERLQNQGTS